MYLTKNPSTLSNYLNHLLTIKRFNNEQLLPKLQYLVIGTLALHVELIVLEVKCLNLEKVLVQTLKCKYKVRISFSNKRQDLIIMQQQVNK